MALTPEYMNAWLRKMEDWFTPKRPEPTNVFGYKAYPIGGLIITPNDKQFLGRVFMTTDFDGLGEARWGEERGMVIRAVRTTPMTQFSVQTLAEWREENDLAPDDLWNESFARIFGGPRQQMAAAWHDFITGGENQNADKTY